MDGILCLLGIRAVTHLHFVSRMRKKEEGLENKRKKNPLPRKK
jgi:hypothetical protein